ncbi:MAG: FecR domain-containing protein [Oscillatoriales cyanobacterium SM2_2_1]|nr:FecR domain-containing protein [Oscillatoriales cyanobacterium SM2_2_1]
MAPPVSRWLKRSLLLLLGVVITLMQPLSGSLVFAQNSTSQATVKEILDGTQVFIQEQQAKVNDIARQRQRVRTGDARAELTFPNGAVARLSKNSSLSIGSCARLQRGALLVNGAANSCTATIVAGVRGTTYVLEVDESGKQEIKVLEGEVVVRREATPDPAEEKPKQFNFPSNPPTITPPRQNEPLEAKPAEDKPVIRSESNETVLKAGERLEIDIQGVLGIVQKLSQGEFERLLKGNLFDGFASQLPGIENIRNSFQNLFPGASFPIPSIPTPNIPIPRLPF